MGKKRNKLPKMSCAGYRQPYLYDVNEKTGMEYWAYPCEGCGNETIIPGHVDIDRNPPLYFKKCGCTQIKALTEYHDDCQKCGGPIYLTPGAAMYKKYSGSSYEQRIDYCDSCLEEVVATRTCRNKACSSVGGEGTVEATFAEQLFYDKKNLTFPPNNCEVCRAAKKVFEKQGTIKKICFLCHRNFYVSGKMMIMILKNEDTFQIPNECRRCANLAPDERKKFIQKIELEKIYKKRVVEVEKALLGDKKGIGQEKELFKKAVELKKKELMELLIKKHKFSAIPSEHKLIISHILPSLSDNKSIPDNYKKELPKAIEAITRITPNAMGLLKPASNWGPHASAIKDTLKHSTKGAGFAYEILGTAALISKESKAGEGYNDLKIYSTDRIDFGIKLQANYFGIKDELTSKHKRGTVEADLFITRPRSAFEGGDKIIGVDFKHSKTGGTYGGSVSKEVIDGFVTAITHGEIEEFHFVTNGKFSETLKENIKSANEDLKAEGFQDGTITYHEYVKYGDM